MRKQKSASEITLKRFSWKNKIFGNTLGAEILRHTSGTLLLKVAAQALAVVTSVILARALGAAGYGTYAFAMAIVGILSVPATGGLPQLIVRNVSQYYSCESFGLLKGLLRRANQFAVVLSLTLVALTGGVYLIVAGAGFASEREQTLLVALLLLPVLALKNVRTAALRGLRKVILGLLPETVVRPLLLILGLGLSITFLPQALTPQRAMFVNLIATTVAFLVGAGLFVNVKPAALRHAAVRYESKKWFTSAVPFMFLGAMHIINKRTDVVMLGWLSTLEDVGVYRAVVNGSMLVTFVLTSVNQAFAPQIAKLWQLQEKDELQRVITKITRWTSLATASAALVLMLGARFFLSVLFGAEFVVGVNALRILCLGQVVSGLSGSVGNIMAMTNHEKWTAFGVLASAVLNVLLNLLLVPRFGMTGAAIATASSVAFTNLLLVYFVFRLTGFKTTVFA